MRTLTTTLAAYQKKQLGLSPLVKLELALDLSSGIAYTYLKDRLIDIKHNEEPYSHKSSILLDNADHALDAVDLKGFEANLSYGAITSAGNEYSASPLLYVAGQEFFSKQGSLQCELSLQGVPDMLAEDRANCTYIPDPDNATTYPYAVGVLLTQILQPSGALYSNCFSHCKDYAFNITEDSLINVYQPRGDFRIFFNGSRLAAIKRLLDMTECVMRYDSTGKIWIAPVNQSSYDSTYNLEPGNMTFFMKAYRNKLVIPNYVVAQSYPDDDPQYSGHNTDASYSIIEKRAYKYAALASNAQAAEIAHAVIHKAQLAARGGSGIVPLNVGQEVYDFVQITDSRQGDTVHGNIGYIHRRVNLSRKHWEMTFGLGGAPVNPGFRKNIEMADDSEPSYQTLEVGDIYGHNLHTDGQVYGDLDLQETYKVINLDTPTADKDAATKEYVGAASPWNPTNYSATTKVVNTVYQNTSGYTLKVAVELSMTNAATGTATAYALIGPSSPPAEEVDRTYIYAYGNSDTVTLEEIRTLHFLIPNNYYYKVVTAVTGPATVAKVLWAEQY
jgi:hypothetical protein